MLWFQHQLERRAPFLHLRAHAVPQPKTVSKLFPLGGLGINDTVYPPERKTCKLPAKHHGRSRPVQVGVCGSNLSGRRCEITQRSLPFLSVVCRVHSTALHTEAPLSILGPTHLLPTTYQVSTCHKSLPVSVTDRFSVPPTFSLASTVGMDASRPLMLCLPILFLPLPLIVSL